MTETGVRPEPLVKRGLVRRVLKGIAVTFGFLFIFAVGFLYWAFKTGRAVEAVRQEIAVELDRRCGVEAEFRKLTLDPLARKMNLEQLSMRHKGGDEIVAVEEAIVRLDLLPLFYGRLQLDAIDLLRPRARIAFVDGVPVNLPECVRPKDDTESAPIVLGISGLSVEDGEVQLAVDDITQIDVADLNVQLKPGVSSGVDLTMSIDDGSVQVGTATHALTRVRLNGHLEGLLSRPRAIVLEQLAVGIGRVDASGSGSIDLLGPVYEAKLGLELPLDAIEDFVPGVPKMKGEARFDVAVAGTFLDPRGAGSVRVKGAKIDAFSLGDTLEVDFSADRRGVKINEVEVRLADGAIRGKGAINFDEHYSASFDTTQADVSLARVFESLGVTGPWVDLIGSGTTQLSGTLDPVVLTGPFEYDVANARVYDGAWDRPVVFGKAREAIPTENLMLAIDAAHATGIWHFGLDGVRLEDIRLTSGATEGHADVAVRFGEPGGVSITTNFPSFDFVDLGPIAGLAFSGVGTMSGEMSGSFEELVGVGAFEFADIEIGGIPFGGGTGTVRWHDIVSLDVSGIQGRLGESSYEGQVQVTLTDDVPLNIFGEVTRGRVEDLLIPFGVDGREWGDPTGKIAAKFDLTGPVTALTGPIDMQVESAAIVGETTQGGRLVGRMERGRVVVDSLQLKKHEGRIFGSGWIDPNLGNLQANLRTAGAKLQSIDLIRTTQPKLDGDLALTFEVGGSFMGVTGTIAADLEEVAAGPVRLGRGRFDGKLRGANIEYVATALRDRLKSTGVIGLGSGIPYTAKITYTDVAAPDIVSGLQGHRDYRGTTTGTADLSGSLVDWHLSSGKVYLEKGVLDLDGVHLETSAPARFTMTRGVLETKRLSITGPRTRLTGEGRFGSQAIDMKVSGRIDLAIAELLNENVVKAGGNLLVDATLGGRPDALTLVGAGRIERGLLEWAGFDNRITAMTADLTFSQSTILIERAVGQWAGGKIAMNGNVLLESYLPRRFTLNLNLTDVAPRMTYPTLDVYGVLTGAVQIFGTQDRIKVRGDLDVRRGRARPKIDLQSLVGSNRIADVYDPSREVVDLDVHFHAKDNVRIKNDDVDLEATGDLRLTGTNERYGMLGTASLIQGGRVAFIGREYTMESGTVTFKDRFRFDVGYDLIMSAQACQARIRVNLVGSFEDVSTTYSSNPEMDERNIVSCLIRGVKVTDLDRDLASFAGSALLKLSGVDRQVKKVLPIDQIDVTTEYSSQARAYEPRVLVAKDLSVLDRPARLEYSSSLLRTNDQRAALRVRLTPRLNLQFGWTSSEDVPYGDWGLDLKQRWEW